MAVVGNGTESLDHLQGRNGNALADPHRSRIDDRHGTRRKQDALLFPRKFDTRNRAEAETMSIFGQ